MVNNIIEAKAEKLLKDSGCYSIPVNIKDCVSYLKIELTEVELEKDLSGFLAFKAGNKAVIGFNKGHGRERTRFTIAHELAHFVLHRELSSTIFIDKDRIPTQNILFRDSNSSTGEYVKEREANAFAAALLMPKQLVEESVRELDKKMEDLIKHLADKFQVSTHAMSIRLANLDIIDYNG